MAEESGNKRPHGDPLSKYGREIAFGLAVLAILLFALSALTPEAVRLPGIAFGWKLGLEIIRAGIAFAVITLVVIVLVRGSAGLWPESFTTSGFDYRLSEEGANLTELLLKLDQLEREVRIRQTGKA